MINGRKIVEYFTYFDETCQEVLELKIRVMNNYVDEFIICESNKTQSGSPIEYKLKQRITELGLPAYKIRVIELDIPDDDKLELLHIDRLNAGDNVNNINSVRSRARERLARDALMSVIDDYDVKTIFIVGDCDEIINPIHLASLIDPVDKNPETIIQIPLVYLQGRADLRAYDSTNGEVVQWDRAMFICTRENFYYSKPIQIRSHCMYPYMGGIAWMTHDGQRIPDMGWHFSWMGDKSRRLKKRDAFCHYDDKFGFLKGDSFTSEETEQIIVEEAKSGVIAYSAANHILNEYPLDSLPAELFQSTKLINFFLPGRNDIQNSIDTPDISIDLNAKYKIVSDLNKPRIWVVDDFYENPQAVRDYALNLEFLESDYHRGKRTQFQHVFPGTKEAFERIMGRKITKWTETYGMCGRFQHCISEDALVYHCDMQKWAAIVYLTPGAPFECGTELLAHKKTKIRHAEDPRIESCFQDLGYPYFLDSTPFETVDVVGNVFNRLVIFDAQSIHAASKYFGSKKEDSRLFQMFFFD